MTDDGVLERIFCKSERSEIFGGSNISIGDRTIAKMRSTWQLRKWVIEAIASPRCASALCLLKPLSYHKSGAREEVKG